MDMKLDFYINKIGKILPMLKDFPTTGKVERSYKEMIETSMMAEKIFKDLGYDYIDIIDTKGSALILCHLGNGFCVSINTSVQTRVIMVVYQFDRQCDLDHLKKISRQSFGMLNGNGDVIRVTGGYKFDGVHEPIIRTAPRDEYDDLIEGYNRRLDIELDFPLDWDAPL